MAPRVFDASGPLVALSTFCGGGEIVLMFGGYKQKITMIICAELGCNGVWLGCNGSIGGGGGAGAGCGMGSSGHSCEDSGRGSLGRTVADVH